MLKLFNFFPLAGNNKIVVYDSLNMLQLSFAQKERMGKKHYRG